MPRQQQTSVENNFIAGLKTEHTGLNFPENACTETFNCTFDRTGKVSRRLGMNYEANHNFFDVNLGGGNVSLSSFFWENADGTGNVNIYVTQIGQVLTFYEASAATAASPLSQKRFSTTLSLTTFVPAGGSLENVHECQYASANGRLFVFNPRCNPFYVTFTAPFTIVATEIEVEIRDTEGVHEPGVEDDFRPSSLVHAHQYNLSNQGWGQNWTTSAPDTKSMPVSGFHTFTNVATDLPIRVGDRIRAIPISGAFTDPGFAVRPGDNITYIVGVVSDYVGTNLVVLVIQSVQSPPGNYTGWNITPEPALIAKWNAASGSFPSNSDVWQHHTSSRDVASTSAGITTTDTFDRFDPARTLGERPAPLGRAPRGYWRLKAWDQQRTEVSGVLALAPVTTTLRPRTGAWFAGRVWYAGVDMQVFTEKIYFSQIIEHPSQLGKCYQVNDPTNDEFFDLLPSDGGVISIPGAGQVIKLFPIQNGLLAFTTTGIWFITGREGIGFIATDYTVVKLSSVNCLTASSFVTIKGYPMWWNEDSIYTIAPGENGALNVQSTTENTIADFYSNIFVGNKRFARGDYNPITGIVQWCFRNTTSGTDPYFFESILNLNTLTGAWYPWTIGTGVGVGQFPITINDIKYLKRAEGSQFKYWTAVFDPDLVVYRRSFAEERMTSYLDWISDYDSYFVTGYKLHGQGQRKFQTNCVFVYSDNIEDTMYSIRSMRNYAGEDADHSSSVAEYDIVRDDFRYSFRKHKLRGTGLVMQFKVMSISGEPFHIIGWSVYETSNARP